MRVGPFAFKYKGNGATPANILIPLERRCKKIHRNSLFTSKVIVFFKYSAAFETYVAAHTTRRCAALETNGFTSAAIA